MISKNNLNYKIQDQMKVRKPSFGFRGKAVNKENNQALWFTKSQQSSSDLSRW